MFDIIIKQNKKESYIKFEDTKIKGFNVQNGVVTPLTIEEVNIINLLKLGDDKSYLGKENDYDVYLDNISGLKHYFKNSKEDIEATWLYNGEDALIYKDFILEKSRDKVKKIKLKNSTLIISSIFFCSIVASSIIITSRTTYSSVISNNSNFNTIRENSTISENSTVSENSAEEITLPSNDIVTLEQIQFYIDNNDKLTEEEKEMVNNTKLLEDIIPYYENTNMNVLIPLKFNELQVFYYYAEPKKDENTNGYVGVEAAFYSPLTPDKLYVNTYFGKENRYDDKVHEYVHLLQVEHECRYIIEASAEIISCEYDAKCVNNAYREPVKNTKILMEMIGPKPIWKVCFSGDETDLVNAIKANLEEEKANKLIDLLKEKPGSDQIENLDTDITALLSEMYTNMYGEDMKTNPFINCLLGNGQMHSRYYFNSDFIEKEIPYTKEQNFNFWPTYSVSNIPVLDVLNDIENPNSEILYILFKDNVKVGSINDFTSDFLEENEVKFYCQGKEISFDSIDLEKYKNIPINYQGDIMLEEKKVNYYPSILELFPDQRISEKEVYIK